MFMVNVPKHSCGYSVMGACLTFIHPLNITSRHGLERHALCLQMTHISLAFIQDTYIGVDYCHMHVPLHKLVA